MPRTPLPLPTCLFLLVSLSSCTEEKIRVYKVASDSADETAAAPAHTAPAHPEPAPEATASRVSWQAPADWKPEAPGQFQTAVFSASSSSRLAISMLPGDSGGIPANINRWRGQIGLEVLPEAEIAGQPLKVADSPEEIHLFNLIPEDATEDTPAVLGAILPLGSEPWYFKFSGPTGELRQFGQAFMDFLRSVRVAPAAEHDHSHGHDHDQGSEQPTPAPALPDIKLSPPADWKPSPSSTMRAASFAILGADGASADVSVIPLPGNSGSVFENVNLWRTQLQLPPLESPDDPALGTKFEGTAGTFFLSHMTSNSPLLDENTKAAISGAILQTSGKHTWFFKMIGEASLVEANREKFEAFVRSATIP